MSAQPRPPDLQNLLARGYLKEAVFAPGSADAYVLRAVNARRGASLAQLDPHDRFVVAYEGLFSLAVGVLARYALRPGDGEGHRVIALQAVLGVLQLDPREVQRVTRLHELRNSKIYRSPLPASLADAADALDCLSLMLAKVLAPGEPSPRTRHRPRK
jgi:hypothetical protein